MRISDWSSDVCSSDLYFHEEVLDLQPEDVRNFLVDTSILNELTTSACAAVTNSESARAMLDHVFASGLFLNATDRERSCYSYHKLFREMVLGRLMEARKRFVSGQRVSVIVVLGGGGIIKKK